MTDKEKIRNIIELFIAWNGETECIDVANLDSAVEFIDSSLQEELISENFEEALAQEWKGYNDRGAATVDALEDNTQELAFAKGFYHGWHYRKEEPVSEDLKNAADNALEGLLDKYDLVGTGSCLEMFKLGAEWQKKKDAELPKIWPRDTIDEYAYQVAYDLSNDWMKDYPEWKDVEIACKLGAEWQRQQYQEAIGLAEVRAMFAGMVKGREEAMKKTIDFLNSLIGIGNSTIEEFKKYMNNYYG